jgi:transmembrane 9 superfamily protein 2/4
VDSATSVVFTYDVYWEASQLDWSNRWDTYLTAHVNNKAHWFSITNSAMIVLFLTVMVAMILIRTLRRDIAHYNDPAAVEDAKEETGWKLVHADVFRPPKTYPMLFSVFVGTGAQLFLMALATLTFALFGFLSPANRGSLITAFILLFVFMGAFAGYFSSRIYKMFRGVEWKQNTLMTAFLYPGTVFVIFFILNLALWSEGSSGAVPFGTFFTLLFLWFGVSVPLVFVGSFFGYKKEVIQHPVRTNQIPRNVRGCLAVVCVCAARVLSSPPLFSWLQQIPQQPWYMNPHLTIAFGGILPFGAVSVELYFIMSALWLHQIYYIFGFLFLVMLILIATCAEVTVLLCYFQLVNEDYKWWWRSFLTSGACAGYMLLYALWYHITELEMEGFVSLMLYYGYMSIITITFFLITGTIGYFACFWFNTKIYGSIKVD